MGAIKSGNLVDATTDEDLSDVEATLRGLGIALRDSNSEFRNFGDVLDEVGSKWGTFSSTQQRAIASAFSGTRQATRFISLMSGWSQAQEYAAIAADSTGAAEEKLAVYQESLEAKTNRLTAAFEAFSTTLLDSDFIGFFLDFGAGALNAMSNVDSAVVSVIEFTAAATTLVTVLRMVATSGFGTSIQDAVKALAWPEMTGDIVAITGKKAA
jgi:hypothetical protein